MEEQKPSSKIDKALNRFKSEVYFSKRYGVPRGYSIMHSQTERCHEEISYPFLWFWERTKWISFNRVKYTYIKSFKQSGFKFDVVVEDDFDSALFYFNIFRLSDGHVVQRIRHIDVDKTEHEITTQWNNLWNEITEILINLEDERNGTSSID